MAARPAAAQALSVVLGAAGHADGADHAAVLDDGEAAAEEDHPWTKAMPSRKASRCGEGAQSAPVETPKTAAV